MEKLRGKILAIAGTLAMVLSGSTALAEAECFRVGIDKLEFNERVDGEEQVGIQVNFPTLTREIYELDFSFVTKDSGFDAGTSIGLRDLHDPVVLSTEQMDIHFDNFPRGILGLRVDVELRSGSIRPAHNPLHRDFDFTNREIDDDGNTAFDPRVVEDNSFSSGNDKVTLVFYQEKVVCE